jgi:hypothetical protein
LFYPVPRLVPHPDAMASEQIRELYGRELQPGMQVLDLMSSWVSHLPVIGDLAVTGLATETVRGLPRPQDDRYADLHIASDPVFAVFGYASGQSA